MQVIIRSPGGLLEEVVLECPGLTWNQVFCELDRMSRSGQVRLTPKGPGLYDVTHTTACDPAQIQIRLYKPSERALHDCLVVKGDHILNQ